MTLRVVNTGRIVQLLAGFALHAEAHRANVRRVQKCLLLPGLGPAKTPVTENHMWFPTMTVAECPSVGWGSANAAKARQRVIECSDQTLSHGVLEGFQVPITVLFRGCFPLQNRIRKMRLRARQSMILNSLCSVITVLLAGVLFTSAVSANTEQVSYGAAMNYRLHCEGCHQADGTGQPGYIPAFKGIVAVFLSTDEGRTYLSRVPGISQSLLSDEERAEVLNWIVNTFDAEHLPVQFVPFTAQELSKWRYDALSEPSLVRAQLVAELGRVAAPPITEENASINKKITNVNSVSQPAAFSICLACHTVSAEGENGVGPNLRGIIGKRVGTSSGFSYSSAMRNAGFVWTPEKLDEFIREPAKVIPGNFMTLGGIQSVEERKAIVDYIKNLD
jgi:cytochrome c2